MEKKSGNFTNKKDMMPQDNNNSPVIDLTSHNHSRKLHFMRERKGSFEIYLYGVYSN